MGFMYGKWRAVEELRALRQKYGENSEIIARDGLKDIGKVKKDEKVVHPNAHLLNKKHKVPQYPVDERFKLKPTTTFRITEAEVKRNAERIAANK